MSRVLERRRCGVLTHIASLPCRHGLGDLGPTAHLFVEFLARAGHCVWQILPLSPVNAGAGNSPYSSYSAFAGNTLFVSPDLLAREGVLALADADQAPAFDPRRIEYERAASWRSRLLEIAFDNALPSLRRDARFAEFVLREAAWLDDFALFMALKRAHGQQPWYTWPLDVRLRDEKGLAEARARLSYDVLREQYWQYLFARQWEALHAYCRELGVSVMGDAPIYVSLDSCDVWANRELFALDRVGLPVYCAGAPPDYFSRTGQMWGNPVYAWERMEADGFSWWIRRLKHEARRYDLLRLDHFRGFCAFWQVPACEPTAENGVWRPAPGERLFACVRKAIPDLELVAEDLGVITPDVTALMDKHGFPGMKILQFAFFGDRGENPYLPHNISPQSVVFTGTHDNNTTQGWYAHELDAHGRAALRGYVGRVLGEDEVAPVLIRLALGSVARLAIIPMQDYLGLGEEGRMNIPGVAGGNWGWRLEGHVLTDSLAGRMRELAAAYGRVPWAAGPEI